MVRDQRGETMIPVRGGIRGPEKIEQDAGKKRSAAAAGSVLIWTPGHQKAKQNTLP